ncbi:MAG: VWA domain-containing protein [Clostridiales bacterium]|nr:VWA domain-containing protein [Clostridiales bacterium]
MKKEINNKENKKEAKNNITEIVFILDRSGSMGGLESDTIGGFNSMIAKQKKEDGECYVTTVLFDSKVETLHDRVKLSEIAEMTDKEYFVRGSTALLDAIGRTIKHISGIHKYVREEDVPANTIFVITTDGMENSSREYSAEKVKKMIEKKKAKGWEFIFLGANIDAVSTAKSFGISEERAVNYHCDSKGVALNFGGVAKAIGSMRACGKMDDSWRAEIDEDFESRS